MLAVLRADGLTNVRGEPMRVLALGGSVGTGGAALTAPVLVVTSFTRSWC